MTRQSQARQVAAVPGSVAGDLVAPETAAPGHRGHHLFRGRQGDKRRSAQRRVLLTGATGSWGQSTLAQLAVRGLPVTAFIQPSQKRIGRKLSAKFPQLRIFYGDLRDPKAVAAAMSDARMVLHLGAVVSPLADKAPQLAQAVNVGGMQAIVAAARARPPADAVEVVAIGSVAQTGDRNPPNHWGRIGDPQRASVYDNYALTKIAAERILIDAGLPRWVSLRQTGILHPGMMRSLDPIMSHPPLEGVIEWVTEHDSARLLASIAAGEAPAELWGHAWNIGGGASFRLTNWQFMSALLGAAGVAEARSWFERRWFATRNFHGHWFADSDALEKLVPFRSDSLAESLVRCGRALRPARILPGWMVRSFVTGPAVRRLRGTMHMILHGDKEAVNAYYGSREAFSDIGGWEQWQPKPPGAEVKLLELGFADRATLRAADARDAAAFRGGEVCDPGHAKETDILQWRCGAGHSFAGSMRLILRSGHWCPTCVQDIDSYERQAEHDQLLAQLMG